MGVNMSIQVSLSNAYALNRGFSHDKRVSVMKTYQMALVDYDAAGEAAQGPAILKQ